MLKFSQFLTEFLNEGRKPIDKYVYTDNGGNKLVFKFTGEYHNDKKDIFNKLFRLDLNDAESSIKSLNDIKNINKIHDNLDSIRSDNLIYTYNELNNAKRLKYSVDYLISAKIRHILGLPVDSRNYYGSDDIEIDGLVFEKINKKDIKGQGSIFKLKNRNLQCTYSDLHNWKNKSADYILEKLMGVTNKNSRNILHSLQKSKNFTLETKVTKDSERYFIISKGGSVVITIIDGKTYIIGPNDYKNTNFETLTDDDIIKLSKKYESDYIKKIENEVISDNDPNSDIDIPDEKSIKNWKLKEIEIAKHLDELFSTERFTINTDDGDNLKPIGEYHAEVAGGGKQSDILISKKMPGKQPKDLFFIESKLNYSTGDFFKFAVTLDGKELKYLNYNRASDDKKAHIEEVFGDTQTDNFFKMVQGIPAISKQIIQFRKNVKAFLVNTYERIKNLPDDSILKTITSHIFEDEDILTNKGLSKIALPDQLKQLVQSFRAYLDFAKNIIDGIEIKKRKDKEEGENIKINDEDMELLEQIKNNLAHVFKLRGESNDIDKFLTEYGKLRYESDILNFVYTKIMSDVKAKRGENTIKQLFRHNVSGKVAEYITDTINEYYANIHNVRYLEIGLTDYKQDEKYSKENWQSNVYILNPKESNPDIPRDPFNLAETYPNKVFDIKTLKDCWFEIRCEVSISCNAFNFRVGILNNTITSKENITFEDIEKIEMKQDLPLKT